MMGRVVILSVFCCLGLYFHISPVSGHGSLGLYVHVSPVSANNCKDPPHLRYGRAKVAADGRRAIYVCKFPYHHIGAHYLTCQSDGRWSGPPPTCISRGCKSMRRPLNGRITYLHVGALALFSCKEGFEMQGSSVVTCNRRNWNGTQPQCLAPQTTTTQPNIHHQQRADYEGFYDDKKTSKYERSYSHEEWLKRADYTCVGQSNTQPPPPIINALPYTRYTIRDSKPRLYTMYRCKWGFQHLGKIKHLYCSKKQWVGSTPRCVLSGKSSENDIYADDPNPGSRSHNQWLHLADYSCLQKDPPSIDQAKSELKYVVLSGSPHLYVQYNCQGGFQPVEEGKLYMYCQEEKWVGDKPSCTKRASRKRQGPCSDNNGGCEQTCTPDGAVARCSCKAGFTLQKDYKSCKDRNECGGTHGQHGCDQICVNYEGGYRCACRTGYMLDKDGHRCISMTKSD